MKAKQTKRRLLTIYPTLSGRECHPTLGSLRFGTSGQNAVMTAMGAEPPVAIADELDAGAGRPRGSKNPNTRAKREAIKAVVAKFEATTQNVFEGDAVALMQLGCVDGIPAMRF